MSENKEVNGINRSLSAPREGNDRQHLAHKGAWSNPLNANLPTYHTESQRAQTPQTPPLPPSNNQQQHQRYLVEDKLGQDLAVEVNREALEAVDKGRVLEAMLSHAGVDCRDPLPPHHPLLPSPVAVAAVGGRKGGMKKGIKSTARLPRQQLTSTPRRL